MTYTCIKTTALAIDRDQARTHLNLLGYKPGDNVYMRFFVPDGDPRHGTPAAARKADKLNWEEVERYQNDGYGVYFVINGGGHTDSDVKVGHALFCEWDDRPIEDQIFAWQELKLPEPTMQVGTRKSVHNYWRADLTKDQWIELQEDLLAYTQSDPKLKNPSRVLRLAGAYHIKPGCEPIRCDIIHQKELVYTYSELRAAIPRRQQPNQPTINYQLSIPDDVPLYQFLTKDDRALMTSGATQGSRNDSGAKLTRNLIGTAQRLNYLGIRFEGDPRQLFDDYCHRCNPPIVSREAEAIWRSAQKSNPTASMTDDALSNCAKAWLRNQEKASGRGTSNYNNSLAPHHNFGGGGTGSGGTGNETGSLDPDERLRLELKALLKEADPVKRMRKRAEIASYYRLNKAEIEFCLRSLDENNKTHKTSVFGLDEFLSMESEGIDYLIPGLLPRGETVLCVGLPKSGKTLLAVDAAFAVATGEADFLSEKVQQGRVLIVSVDESAHSTKAKLIKRGFRASDAANVRVITRWDISQIDILEQTLEDFHPDLVVIDSLKRITAGREVSENSAEFADMIYKLKELLTQYNCAGLLIHHSNKNAEAVGVARVRGSTAIAGACWGIWSLDIPALPDDGKKALGKRPKFDPSNPNRVLSVIPRDTEGQLLNIRFNPENHSYNIFTSDEEASVAQERKSQEELILGLLRDYHPHGLTGREILESLELGRGAYSTLNRMVERRLITQRQSTTDHRMMVYCLPKKSGDTLPPPVSVGLLNKISETTVVEIKTNSQQIVSSFQEISQQANDENGGADDSIGQLTRDTAISQQESSPRGGEGPPLASDSSSEAESITEKLSSLTEAIAPTPTATPDKEALAFEEVEVNQWMQESAIAEIARDLANENFCDNKEFLAILRGCWNPQAMNAACKRLSPERHARIKQWVIELNQALKVGDRVFVEPWPHTDRLGPYPVERIEGEFAKVEGFAQLLPLTELRRA